MGKRGPKIKFFDEYHRIKRERMREFYKRKRKTKLTESNGDNVEQQNWGNSGGSSSLPLP